MQDSAGHWTFEHCVVLNNSLVISQMSFLLEPQSSQLRPGEQDMEGVTQALARIQFVYRYDQVLESKG